MLVALGLLGSRLECCSVWASTLGTRVCSKAVGGHSRCRLLQTINVLRAAYSKEINIASGAQTHPADGSQKMDAIILGKYQDFTSDREH